MGYELEKRGSFACRLHAQRPHLGSRAGSGVLCGVQNFSPLSSVTGKHTPGVLIGDVCDQLRNRHFVSLLVILSISPNDCKQKCDFKAAIGVKTQSKNVFLLN